MQKKQIILVTGATGAQGGSVARHLLAGSKFAVRCLTRHPDSEAAKALSRAGADVVQGDLGDRESLARALKGCYGAFGVTNFWEHFEREFELGQNLLNAVAEAGLGHFVFSTLPYCKKISGGKLDVPHFDLKAQLEERSREMGIRGTHIHCAFYYENFLAFFPPQKQDDGTYAIGFPQGDVPLSGVSVEDVGSIVAPIFENPDAYLGKVVGIVGDDLTGDEYAEHMTRVLGTKVVYHHVPRETFAAYGFPGAEDLANMFEFNRLYIPNRRKDIEACRAINPKMQTFEGWLKTHKHAFEAVFAPEHAGAR